MQSDEYLIKYCYKFEENIASFLQIIKYSKSTNGYCNCVTLRSCQTGCHSIVFSSLENFNNTFRHIA